MAAGSWYKMSPEGWRRSKHALLYAAAAIILLQLGIGWYWSREPEIFWVSENADGERTVVGYPTTDTLIRVAEHLLDKPGGYLTNDVTPSIANAVQ